MLSVEGSLGLRYPGIGRAGHTRLATLGREHGSFILSGHVKDDSSVVGSRRPGQYETCPPGGATRTAAILRSVVQAISKLVELLANESVETDQAADKILPANESVEAGKAVVKDGKDI